VNLQSVSRLVWPCSFFSCVRVSDRQVAQDVALWTSTYIHACMHTFLRLDTHFHTPTPTPLSHTHILYQWRMPPWDGQNVWARTRDTRMDKMCEQEHEMRTHTCAPKGKNMRCARTHAPLRTLLSLGGHSAPTKDATQVRTHTLKRALNTHTCTQMHAHLCPEHR
jgi:hypothetical protein